MAVSNVVANILHVNYSCVLLLHMILLLLFGPEGKHLFFSFKEKVFWLVHSFFFHSHCGYLFPAV